MVTSTHARGPHEDRPAHVADLLRLLVRDPGRPRLTWYGDDGERVELSGAVLENWVNKTTNLLVEEFDAGPGARVVLDLPAHWRTTVWALAAWRVGATVVLADDDATTGERGTRADVVVTGHPDRWAGTRAELVAVALPALARRFDGDLPAGAVDAASAVMTYGDQVGWAPEVDLTATAIASAEALLHRNLLAHADIRTMRRILIEDSDVHRVLLTSLRAWSDDGSVVLLAPSVSVALGRDLPRRARLVASERVDED